MRGSYWNANNICKQSLVSDIAPDPVQLGEEDLRLWKQRRNQSSGNVYICMHVDCRGLWILSRKKFQYLGFSWLNATLEQVEALD